MKLVIILIVFSTISTSVIADSASHRRMTEELLLALNIEGQMLAIGEDAKQMQYRQFQSSKPPPEAQKIFQDYIDAMMKLIFSALSWENVKSDYINAYISVFEEREIEDLLTFFHSKSGRKYVEKMPELNRLVLQVAEKKMQQLQPQLETLNSQFANKMESAAKK